MRQLSLTPINANVHSVHQNGAHVGNLKRIGEIWKFKAIGYDNHGAVEPGGGPFTDWHNAQFEAPDANALSARLAAPPVNSRP